MNLGNFLRKHLRHKELGWKPIGEVFYRYQLVKTRWFNIYLHQLTAPQRHSNCHDHPWWFVTLILWNGYVEETAGGVLHFRHAGNVLYRPAKFKHNVITPWGTAWSLIITGPKSREWGFLKCIE
jgi:hypothetical protein